MANWQSLKDKRLRSLDNNLHWLIHSFDMPGNEILIVNNLDSTKLLASLNKLFNSNSRCDYHSHVNILMNNEIENFVMLRQQTIVYLKIVSIYRMADKVDHSL